MKTKVSRALKTLEKAFRTAWGYLASNGARAVRSKDFDIAVHASVRIAFVNILLVLGNVFLYWLVIKNAPTAVVAMVTFAFIPALALITVLSLVVGVGLFRCIRMALK